MKNKDYDTTSVILARTIGAIRTNIDLLSTIGKYQKKDNDFWNLVFKSLYDLIIIDSFKLIDKKNLSLFSLINEAKGIVPQKAEKLGNDYKELQEYINAPEFNIIQHRHTQKAHHSRKVNNSLPRFANLGQIIDLLNRCESLIKKYNVWIKGDKYSIDFNSNYVGGHNHLLEYVAKIIS